MTADGRHSIGRLATAGVFWSVVQTWSNRLITFVIFVVLARFLSPVEYGMATAAWICLMLIGIIAEFGFGDAIVQRRDLKPSDINLPFAFSIGLSILLALGAALLAPWLEQVMKVANAGPLIIGLAAIAPLTTISLFQEFSYRRNLDFKNLATRVLIANTIGGIVAIIAAYLGAGAWSLILQNYLTVIIGLIWLWRRPYWRPTREFHLPAFKEMARFGLPVFSLRLIDFAATRLVDVIIVWRFGVAVLGIYAVGSRLYATMMQLLQGALNSVSLSVLSRIADDRARMAQVYLRAITLSSLVAAPAFTLVAALSNEICAVAFGAKWEGVDRISQPLMLVGAIQCIQFLNGPYLTARGKPGLILKIGIVKYAAMIIGLVLLPSSDVVMTVAIFACLQLVATPPSFIAVARELHIPLLEIVRTLAPSLVAHIAAFFSVILVRPLLPTIESDMIRGIELGTVFCFFYGAVVLLVGRSQAMSTIAFVRKQLFKRSDPKPEPAASSMPETGL